MSEKSGESAVGRYLGAPIGGALTALLTWFTAPSMRALAPARRIASAWRSLSGRT